MSLEEFQYDIIIIGAGSAGLACAKESKDLGASVAVIDFVKPTPRGNKWGVGGTCLNVGCIPKIHMHHAALLAEVFADAAAYGWQGIAHKSQIPMNWPYLVQQIQDCIKSTSWVLKVDLRVKKIDFFNGMATMIDKHTVKVNLENKTAKMLTGKYIVIAVGARPVYPRIHGATQNAITTDDLFFLPKSPGKTLIVGAGYISTEIAGILRMFDCEVHIMARNDFLKNFDRQMAAIIVNSLKDIGVKFLMPCMPVGVTKRSDNRVNVKYINRNTKLENVQIFDTVLWAMGREPMLDELKLSAVGVKVENKFIVTDDHECTNVENIFAIGDVAKDRPQLQPTAVMAGRKLAKRLFNNCQDLMSYKNVPTTLFTPIEYGFVGMSEETALKLYNEENIDVYHGYYMPIDYNVTDKSNDSCYVKIIAKRDGEQDILGIHFIGPQAGNVIQGFAVALNCGITVPNLLNTLGVNITNAQQLVQTLVTKRSGLDPAKEFYI